MAGIDIGIDLGTTTTIVYMNGEIVMQEPSVVAIDKRYGDVIAVGEEAFKMLGRTPDYISAEFPLKEGVISDYQMAEFMINAFVKRVCGSLIVKPQIAICIPSFITGVERRAVSKTALSAGARRVILIEEPIAAAIGSGIPIEQPIGRMVVDIGGGTSDIAIISLSGIVVSKSIRLAGNHLNEAVIKFVLDNHKVLIGEKTAENLKIALGCVFNPDPDKTSEVKGRHIITGLPKRVLIDQESLSGLLIEMIDQIIEVINDTLEEAPPEIAGDIHTNGILMTGGGSLLKGFAQRVEIQTKIKTAVSNNPIECVAVGTGRAFEYAGDMQDGFSVTNGHDRDF